jgi:hypothetical protein
LTVVAGGFLGVVVDVSDAAFAALGAIPARTNDNAIVAVTFFILILRWGFRTGQTISKSREIRNLIGSQQT